VASLSTRYARTLFELALERGLASDYMEQAAFISDMLKDEDCQRIITHPRIPEAEKFVFFDKGFKGRIHDDLLGFMRLTVTKNRETFLVPALDELVEMIRRHKNYAMAKVVSAIELDDEQKAQLKVVLARKLGKSIELSASVDPSVIGGFRLHVDGHVFDRTLRYMLRDMKESMQISTNT